MEANMHNDTIDIVVDARTELGECPVWDDVEGRLYWIDILGSSIARETAASGRDETCATASQPG